jgi:dUTP pyrophosphatase
MSTFSVKQQFDRKWKGGYATLKLAFSRHCIDDDFIHETRMAIDKHNKGILSSAHPDSGFDLRVPHTEVFNQPFKSQFVNLGVKSSMSYGGSPCGFLMHPRSSISKTPLMLANHTGIIDSGYRGPLIAALRYLPCDEGSSYTISSYTISSYTIEKNTRIMQICHPSLCPIFVMECDESDLNETERGEGGFGSTGN